MIRHKSRRYRGQIEYALAYLLVLYSLVLLDSISARPERTRQLVVPRCRVNLIFEFINISNLLSNLRVIQERWLGKVGFFDPLCPFPEFALAKEDPVERPVESRESGDCAFRVDRDKDSNQEGPKHHHGHKRINR